MQIQKKSKKTTLTKFFIIEQIKIQKLHIADIAATVMTGSIKCICYSSYMANTVKKELMGFSIPPPPQINKDATNENGNYMEGKYKKLWLLEWGERKTAY